MWCAYRIVTGASSSSSSGVFPSSGGHAGSEGASGVSRVLVSAVFLLLVACTRTPAQSPLVVSSDPRLASMAAELLPDLAARAGLPLVKPVRVERRSREQLVGYLTAKLDEELPVELEDRLTRSYALLGLVPADLDLRGLLLSVYTEQVAGFYDPDSTALFVMEDQPLESLRTVLIHELVHAVQDQAADLDSLTARERGNDRQTAAQAAIEGHATLVMLEYAMEQIQGRSVDLSTLDGFGEQIRQTLGTIRTQFPALGAAPRIVQEALLFPYLEGAGFVQRVWREQGSRPAPLGAHLPLSTEQVLHPERLIRTRDDPREVAIEVPGARVLHHDVLGQLETRLFIEELSGDRGAPDAAAGWGGDRYALVETAAGEALVWVVVWDDEAHRQAFRRRLLPHLGRLPAAARLDLLEVGGLPGLLLRVGDVGDVRVSLVDVRGESPSTGYTGP